MRHRGESNRPAAERLTEEQILARSDAYYLRHGDWPRYDSGTIAESPCEQWRSVSDALRIGARGLPGGSSLAKLLHERRGARQLRNPPDLTEEQVLEWADAWHARYGRWPTSKSGRIDGVPGETWSGISAALQLGSRSLPGGSSLARLLDERRGLRRARGVRPLTEALILNWADAYFARYGRWPTARSGPVADSPGETWTAVALALRRGARGLSAGSSLPQLLIQHRGAPHGGARPSQPR